MARQRLGVVLLVPQPLATEISGIRRALGDGSMARIAPHITLVPPINVNERDLSTVLRHVRAAAAASKPLALRLGPVATFAPVNPTAYLKVGGDPIEVEGLVALRAAVRSGPLAHEDVHDFVPHVTVAEELTPERLEAAVGALASYGADMTVDRVHVMVQQPGRVWAPIADSFLGGGPSTVGRGSLPLDITETARPDVAAAALLATESEPNGRPWALTARSDGEIVGAAWGWTNGEWLLIADFVVAAHHRGLGIGRHLLKAVEALAVERGSRTAGVAAPAAGAPASLLQSAGWSPSSSTGADRVLWHRIVPSEADGG